MNVKAKIDQPELSEAVVARIRTMKIFGASPLDRACMREAITQFARRPGEHHACARKAVGLIGFPQSCPRPSCRRARRCTTSFVVCQFEREYDYEPHCRRFADNDEKYGDPFHGVR
jgi:hypothetical protein